MARFPAHRRCAPLVYVALGVAYAVLTAAGAAAASYNEYTDGDLSGDVLAPTLLNLDPGGNSLILASSFADHDLLRITIPANHVLDTIIVDFHEGDVSVFAALQQSATWTAGVGYDIDPALLLGWTDFPAGTGQSHTGQDILAGMALGAGAIGFQTPLSGGEYTFLFQTQTISVPFALNFVVTAPIIGALPGDFNGNQAVNGIDYALWRVAFGATAGADADGDGDSDGADFLIWQRNMGRINMGGAGGAVPEPGGFAIASAVLAACTARNRRRHAPPGHPVPGTVTLRR